MTLAGLILEAVLWVFIGLLWIRFIVDWVQVFARSWEPFYQPSNRPSEYREQAWAATETAFQAFKMFLDERRVRRVAGSHLVAVAPIGRSGQGARYLPHARLG